MQHVFDASAAKKPTNVSINSDLLARARELKINLSATLERALVEQISARPRELWRQENRQAIDAYSQLVAEGGVFSDGLRDY